MEDIDLRYSPSFAYEVVLHIPSNLQCLAKFGVDESLKLQEKIICRLVEGSPRLVEYELGNLVFRIFEFHSPHQDNKVMEDQQFKKGKKKLETFSSFEVGKSNFPTSIKHKKVDDREEIDL